MDDQYKTLESPAEGIFKDKGSRFIAHALPAGSLDEVRQQLESLKRKYHDARHHCYAYRLGEPPYDFRYNDDGEPSGTAGKPVYGQIQSFGLTNLLIVVTRYFGGIKLGTGGLIQAYRAAARDAITNGNIIIKNWMISLKVSHEYACMNDVMRTLKEENARILKQEFISEPIILLEIRKGKKAEIIQKLKSIEKVEVSVI
ncbi:MAG: YigZ family protein [Bacteroidales bacterium]|nr:YigZ family protein [Bacteroidales bacterium]